MENYIIGFLGKKGSGKTELVKKIIPKFDRLIIVDNLREYDGLIAYEYEELYAHISEFRDFKKFKIVFRPTSDDDKDQFFKLMTTVNNFTLILEEVDYYATPMSIEPDLLHNIKYGRHYGRNLIYIARRTSEVSRFLTSQSDLIISFIQQEPRDLDHLKRYNFNRDIATLDKYEYAWSGDEETYKKFFP